MSINEAEEAISVTSISFNSSYMGYTNKQIVMSSIDIHE